MKEQIQPLEHDSVKQYCKALRVPMIGAHFVQLAEQAAATAARRQAAATENAGRVRLQPGTADSGGEDSRTDRRRLH